jgi:hypothetical protein
MKAQTLSWIAKRWGKDEDSDYPQTWYHMPKRKRFPWTRAFLQFLCGLLGGHELSKTEWGYGGGDYADRWCRWCDKMIQVPRESIYFQFKDSEHSPREIMNMVGKPVFGKTVQ